MSQAESLGQFLERNAATGLWVEELLDMAIGERYVPREASLADLVVEADVLFLIVENRICKRSAGLEIACGFDLFIARRFDVGALELCKHQ